MKRNNRIRLSIIILLIGTTFSAILASTFNCTGSAPNFSCAGSDSFSLASNLMMQAANKVFSDAFHLADSVGINQFTQRFRDSITIVEGSLKFTCQCNVPATTTVTLLPSSTNPFVNNDTPLNTTITTLIAPFIFLFIVIVCGFLVGMTKASMILGFIFLGVFGLAAIGIFPSYFTLLGIIFVSGIMTMMILRFFGGNQAGGGRP